MTCRLCCLGALVIAISSVAVAQTTGSAADFTAPVSVFTCNPWRAQIYSTNLSLSERSCLEFSELASPGLVAESAFSAAISQWRNNPRMGHPDSDDISVRFEHLYERRAARITAETIVGYLHHEDPRLRYSGKQGNWYRTGAALLSVLESPDQNGNNRIALAPLAGSLGSGFTSMALYQRQTSVGYCLERSAFVYGHYFARALYHEFAPDLWQLAPKFIRKYHPATISVD